jgi:hemerythrin-like metal-binding protein
MSNTNEHTAGIWTSWDEKYATGHSGMDRGHKSLMELVNQLADKMENKEQKEFCSDTIGQFLEHAGKHFLAEEAMMDQYQYPKAMEHKALHATMLKDVLAFKESYDAGSNTESITLLVVLESWLKRDIMVADKELANFVATVG